MDVSQTLKSIVRLRSTIHDDAFTASALGTRREGSGVVIRADGLVLTIGYLITEAEEVWLTTQDGASSRLTLSPTTRKPDSDWCRHSVISTYLQWTSATRPAPMSGMLSFSAMA